MAGQRALLHRLISIHHTKIARANKDKLSRVVSLLLLRLRRLARAATRAALAQATPLAVAIYAIGQQLPAVVAELVLKTLIEAWHRWKRSTSSKAEGTMPHAREWTAPGPETLAVLALATQLYPPSDFRHAVLTPCLLFLGDVLAQSSLPCSTVGLRRCIFCCDLVYKCLKPAKRFMPELHGTVLRLLHALLKTGSPTSAEGGSPSVPWALPHAIATSGCASSAPKMRIAKQQGVIEQEKLSGHHDPPSQVIEFSVLAEGYADSEGCLAGGGSVNEAASIFRLVEQLATLHAELPSFPELFRPALEDLQQRGGGLLSEGSSLATAYVRCLAHLEATVPCAESMRVPLHLHCKVPVPLKQFNPAFEVDFQPDRSLDPDRERAVMQQLVRKVKNEKKGAARELRKDAAFLAAERHTQHKATSDYLNARGKRALQIMEEQEAIMKKKV